MSVIARIVTVALVGAMAVPALGQDLPEVRAAVLQTGTVNWELDTIERNGFDTAEGFDLVVQGFADNGATRIALEGGEADVMVADWIWVARQRAAGKDYVFIPYSKAVGAIVVPGDSPAQTLADLKGAQIGIAGGPLDKSWLILRAYATQEYGMDLAGETEQVFGAPPLVFKTALQGETDAAINFWHFLAKMTAGGMRELMTVSQATEALGLDPEMPLLGYVLKGEFVTENPEVAAGLVRASRSAKTLLAEDDAAWEPLRERMNAADDAEFEALRAGFRSGIPGDDSVDPEAADAFLQLMAELGGEELVGTATTLPEGLFLSVGE